MTIDHDTRPSTLQQPDLSTPAPRTRRWAAPARFAAVAAVAVVGLTQFQDDTHRDASSSVPASEVAMTKSQILVQQAIDAALTDRVNVSNDRRTKSTTIVIGKGPMAVYVGRVPALGGDPARGETDDSYFARTGRHLPAR